MQHPIYGGRLREITQRVRIDLLKQADLCRAIAQDNAADYKIVHGVEVERLLQTVDILLCANFCYEFPTPISSSFLNGLTNLRGFIDLNNVVVITGFAEVGPWGSSRTC